jgi:hypothetical protein
LFFYGCKVKANFIVIRVISIPLLRKNFLCLFFILFRYFIYFLEAVHFVILLLLVIIIRILRCFTYSVKISWHLWYFYELKLKVVILFIFLFEFIFFDVGRISQLLKLLILVMIFYDWRNYCDFVVGFIRQIYRSEYQQELIMLNFMCF